MEPWRFISERRVVTEEVSHFVWRFLLLLDEILTEIGSRHCINIRPRVLSLVAIVINDGGTDSRELVYPQSSRVGQYYRFRLVWTPAEILALSRRGKIVWRFVWGNPGVRRNELGSILELVV
jgi:hypothetical protein